MPSKNDITGDSLISKVSSNSKYADGWDRIFGKKQQQQPNIPTEEEKQIQKEQAQDPKNG